jgi:hypothetical protein
MKTFAAKGKIISGQSNPGNQTSKEMANYKKYILTTLCSNHSLKFYKHLFVCLSPRLVWRVLLLIP